MKAEQRLYGLTVQFGRLMVRCGSLRRWVRGRGHIDFDGGVWKWRGLGPVTILRYVGRWDRGILVPYMGSLYPKDDVA